MATHLRSSIYFFMFCANMLVVSCMGGTCHFSRGVNAVWYCACCQFCRKKMNWGFLEIDFDNKETKQRSSNPFNFYIKYDETGYWPILLDYMTYDPCWHWLALTLDHRRKLQKPIICRYRFVTKWYWTLKSNDFIINVSPVSYDKL